MYGNKNGEKKCVTDCPKSEYPSGSSLILDRLETLQTRRIRLSDMIHQTKKALDPILTPEPENIKECDRGGIATIDCRSTVVQKIDYLIKEIENDTDTLEHMLTRLEI